jgi:ubiquitin carboxyl-terminal hydrolase 5/13
MITMMGFPELSAKHALIQTGNSNPEAALAWLFENMENPILS